MTVVLAHGKPFKKLVVTNLVWPVAC